MATTTDQVLNQIGLKKPDVKKCRIATDPEIADRFESAKDAYDKAWKIYERIPDNTAARAEYEEAKDLLDQATEELMLNSIEFVFRAIGRKAYEDLILEHPPTPAQQAKAKKLGQEGYSWNPDTFPPALIAASMMGPTLLSPQEVLDQIWDNPAWSGPETVLLFGAAIGANESFRQLDLPKG